ncbi:MAG: hypothetical protein AB3P11_03860 [Wolbachia pipientis]
MSIIILYKIIRAKADNTAKARIKELGALISAKDVSNVRVARELAIK